jgi:hypothetical protein
MKGLPNPLELTDDLVIVVSVLMGGRPRTGDPKPGYSHVCGVAAGHTGA